MDLVFLPVDWNLWIILHVIVRLSSRSEERLMTSFHTGWRLSRDFIDRDLVKDKAVFH